MNTQSHIFNTSPSSCYMVEQMYVHFMAPAFRYPTDSCFFCIHVVGNLLCAHNKALNWDSEIDVEAVNIISEKSRIFPDGKQWTKDRFSTRETRIYPTARWTAARFTTLTKTRKMREEEQQENETASSAGCVVRSASPPRHNCETTVE